MVIDNTPAMHSNAQVKSIKNYMQGQHNVLLRKDFVFKNETFRTAKIVLQSIKSIVDFHSSYICGNPVTLNGEKDKLKIMYSIYKKAMYNKVDYNIAKDIYTYGNAFEYVYRDENGVIKSKVIRAEDGYPIYDSNGNYVSFIEEWIDLKSDITHQIVYTKDSVMEYSDNILVEEYNNISGLPIHYTSGSMDDSGFFGTSIVSDLIPIMNEIEQLLSKMSDSVTTLSLNPLGVSVGDRVDTSVDSNVTGAVLNVEGGGDFKWAAAELDIQSITKILDSLIGQFYTIAQVPSVLYGQGNVANISEVSLKLLFNTADNIAKRVSFNLIDGMEKRLEYIGNILGVDFQDVDVTFNYNRPVDNSSIVNDIKTQIDMGIMSKDTAMKISPYITDIEKENKRLDEQNEKSKNADVIIDTTLGNNDNDVI